MLEILKSNLEEHFESIKKASNELRFFVSISDYADFVIHSPLLKPEIDVLQSKTENQELCPWFEEINWLGDSKSLSAAWKKILFIRRIVNEGEEWVNTLKCAPSDSNREQYDEWMIVASALSEFKDFKKIPPIARANDRRYFLTREHYEHDIKRIHNFLRKELGNLSTRLVHSQDKNFIRSILFQETNPNDTKLQYVINGDFSKIKKALNKKNWHNLYRLAEQGTVQFDSNGEAKKFKDYFNSDSKNGLWTKRLFEKRPLLTIEGRITVKAINDFSLEVLNQREWTKYINNALR